MKNGWTLLNDTLEKDIVISVSALFLFCLIMWLSSVKGQSDWSRNVEQAIPVLIVLALIMYFWGSQYPWLPEVLVAWGTIFLALMTFRLGKVTVDENEKLIEMNKKMIEDNEKARKQQLIYDSKTRIRV